MNHQDKNYLKALAYLYGKDSVPHQEYQSHLEKVLGGTWQNIYQEMDKNGFLKLNRKVTSNTNFPDSYSITEAGTTYYGSLLQELEDIEKEGKQGTSRTNWTRIIGWGTLVLIVLTGYLIYLQFYPPKSGDSYSKGMDSVQRVGFQQRMDSLADALNDSSSKADTNVLSVPAPYKLDSFQKMIQARQTY